MWQSSSSKFQIKPSEKNTRRPPSAPLVRIPCLTAVRWMTHGLDFPSVPWMKPTKHMGYLFRHSFDWRSSFFGPGRNWNVLRPSIHLWGFNIYLNLLVFECCRSHRCFIHGASRPLTWPRPPSRLHCRMDSWAMACQARPRHPSWETHGRGRLLPTEKPNSNDLQILFNR